MLPMTIATKQCCVCYETGLLIVSAEGGELYKAGALVQEAFPEMSAPEREQLISGIHPEC